ncbi:MAG TPA: hypothetical protein VIJ93_10085, partial [bacterium]
ATATNSPTPTPTNTVTPTPTNTVSPTPTNTATVTNTPRPQVAIQKTASKGNAQALDVVAYTITLSVTNGAASNVVVQDALPSQMTFQSFTSSPLGTLTSQNGSLLTWALPPSLPVGTYQLAYKATVNSLAQGGVGLCNQAWVNYAQGGPVTASACVTVQGNNTVRIGVYNEAGELVKQILLGRYTQALNNIQLTSNSITTLYGQVGLYFQGNLISSWDGTNSQGNLVSNGTYNLKVDNIDPYGVDTSLTQQVVVNRALYQTTVLIYNEAGEVVRHLYSYVDNPSLAEVTSITLSTTVLKPAPVSPPNGIPNQAVITMSNGTTVEWDGKSDNGAYVTAGKYLIAVQSGDGKGGNSTSFGTITVLAPVSGSGMGTVTAKPNVLNSAAGTASTTFQSDSTTALTLRAFIYTVAGELVAKIEGVSGSGQAVWNVNGLASGVYLAVVEVRDAQGGLMGRQAVKVLVVH